MRRVGRATRRAARISALTIEVVREFLKRPDCIIFVGSGISMWSGLPTWRSLLDELAEHMDQEGLSSDLVRREILSGELLQAASYGVSKLTTTSFGNYIRKAVRAGQAAPHAIHNAIVNLGPTSFITTNYDGLLEDALRQWRTDAFFPAPITNKHLVELVEIVSARSSHFIFKPHGDAGDISSIILTREQYRSLMPGGDRHNALEAVKTLLTTRPVMYVGFGLRDPDFIYLRDLLLNIYQGAVRDHWAIMPDVTSDEVEYWRSHYGIRLLGYDTNIEPDGRKGHGALLSTLQELATRDAPQSDQPHRGGFGTAERTLALTRYTSGLARRLSPTTQPIEARISAHSTVRGSWNPHDRYQGWTTTRFLLEGPDAGHLIGLPGSGKSFALKLAAHSLATDLQQACLEDKLNDEDFTIPIIVDLKLYRGNLREQIINELPAGTDLDEFIGNTKVKLFLDAYNEMPSEHIESGELFRSLESFGQEVGSFTYAISSRTTDALPTEASFYEIDRFEERHVNAVLSKRGIVLDGMLADDAIYLLSRPFFLQLVTKGAVELPPNPTPRDLFASFLGKLQEEFSARFGADLALLPILSRVAYRAIESESEAFPLVWLSDAFSTHGRDENTFSVTELINWLIAREFLIPYTGRRCSFVHQSITEYCASSELARRFQLDALSVREVISSKKWDQCLFLALMLLDRKTANEVLATALEADVGLAIGAARYAEDGQSEAVSRILQALIDRGEQFRERIGFNISLRHLPASEEHVPLLRALLADGDSLGSEVVRVLAEILGPSFKDELLDLLSEHWNDFNFAVNGIAPALSPLIESGDLPRVLEIATRSIEERKHSDSSTAVSAVMSRFAPEVLAPIALAPDCPAAMIGIVAGAMRDRNDEAAHLLLAELLLINPNEVASDFSLALPRFEDASTWNYPAQLDGRHALAVWEARFSSSIWCSALKSMCSALPNIADTVNNIPRNSTMDEIALSYCTNGNENELFNNVKSLFDRSDAELSHETFGMFDLADLNWSGRLELLLKGLAIQNVELQESLLQNSYRYQSYLPSKSANIDDVVTLLKQLDNEAASEEAWWLRHRLAEFIGHIGDNTVRSYCLSGLLNGSKLFKKWVKDVYLGNADLTSDALSDDMISILLADLNVPGRIQEYWYNPLGHIATEQLVVERLLPLAEGASPTFRENLSIVLRAAGNRHLKRYLLPS